jgi:hypothetical protein
MEGQRKRLACPQLFTVNSSPTQRYPNTGLSKQQIYIRRYSEIPATHQEEAPVQAGGVRRWG